MPRRWAEKRQASCCRPTRALERTEPERFQKSWTFETPHSPSEPVPKLGPQPDSNPAKENYTRGMKPGRNLCPALHTATQSTIVIRHADPRKKNRLCILQGALGANDRDFSRE